MGIKRKIIKPAEWRVMVPAEIALKVELLLMDPVRGKPTYGARSALVTELLIAYLQKQEASCPTTPPSQLQPLLLPSTSAR